MPYVQTSGACVQRECVRDEGRGVWWLILQRVQIWRQVRRSRKLLENLPDHALLDLGLTRADVRREVARSFWDHNRTG
ncbi:DUF1127 domain-containing protein [Roseibium suaedae]|uniref:Uncharacterized conserved protein YjiS, DUF1127 family n=1 Tax=Roseibium suaedae TaxID=735517 RepID=A0A1M7GA29_9HYPH|nr:DUF1127 domain-containing protein [Roseibium suaedae]SHM13254.1 Uncharacterized conserved protein YjiS, DUF1127 family [Roseibium suaedae]